VTDKCDDEEVASESLFSDILFNPNILSLFIYNENICEMKYVLLQ